MHLSLNIDSDSRKLDCSTLAQFVATWKMQYPRVRIDFERKVLDAPFAQNRFWLEKTLFLKNIHIRHCDTHFTCMLKNDVFSSQNRCWATSAWCTFRSKSNLTWENFVFEKQSHPSLRHSFRVHVEKWSFLESESMLSERCLMHPPLKIDYDSRKLDFSTLAQFVAT